MMNWFFLKSSTLPYQIIYSTLFYKIYLQSVQAFTKIYVNFRRNIFKKISLFPLSLFNPLPCPSVSPSSTLFRHQTTITITTVKLDVPLYPVRVTATSIFSARASPMYSILTLCVPFSPRLPPKISPRTTITITNSTLPNEASLSLRGNASSIFSLQPHSPTNSLLSTKHGGTC